jgi:hypothetical protein
MADRSKQIGSSSGLTTIQFMKATGQGMNTVLLAPADAKRIKVGSRKRS